MKIAILIAGEYRQCDIAHKFWSFLNWPDVDCYFATWSTSHTISMHTPYTPDIDLITEERIRNIIPNAVIDLGDPGDGSMRQFTADRMLNRWKKSITMMRDSGIIYDRVILVRTDIALKYDDAIFKNFMYTHPMTDSALHGITCSGDIDVDQNISSLGFMSDLSLFGTYNGILKLLEIADVPPGMCDIHSFLAQEYIKIYEKFFNSPIDNQCIVRSNCATLVDPTFDDCNRGAKEWWETRYKKYVRLIPNVWNSANCPNLSAVEPNPINSAAVNLWNRYDFSPWPESNKALSWNSPDDPARYIKNKNNIVNKNHVTYEPRDITYHYDNYGFRKSEPEPSSMTDPETSEYPSLLVAGCSITEGIGLPENHIWHSLLVNHHLHVHAKKPILKFNLGKGGTGISSVTRYVYNTIQHRNFSPDMVYLLLPPVSRQELIVDEPNLSIWDMMPNLPPPASDYVKAELFRNFSTTNYRQQLHQCFQNLLLIKWLLHSKNIPWFFSTWSHDLFINTRLPISEIDSAFPEELMEHYIPVKFNYSDSYVPDTSKAFPQTIGRDYMHPGPNSHMDLSKQIYSKLLQKNAFAKIILKWKNK